jgi:hypothetical protein
MAVFLRFVIFQFRFERVMKYMICFAAGLLMAACATGPFDAIGVFLPPLHRQALDRAAVCCASFRDIKYEKLSRSVESGVDISSSSPVFEFDGQRSFFAAYELPAGDARFLVVTTVPVNMVWNPAGHVMIPSIQFVDGDYKAIEITHPRYQTSSGWRGAWAEALVRVPSNAKYAILIDTKSAGGLSWRDGDKFSGEAFVRNGPTGKVGIKVLGE